MKHKSNNRSQGTPAFGKLRQGDGKLKVGLGYRAGQLTKNENEINNEMKRNKKGRGGFSGDVFAQHA